jgi:quinol monooxygenase YgiN
MPASTTTIIVAGTLTVAPEERERYLEGCRDAVAAARAASGCLDYALSADLLDGGRINVYERWRSRRDLHRFRGSGPSDDQLDALIQIRVAEFDVVEVSGAPAEQAGRWP